MADLTPQRRPFQFSISRLMLWTVIWAVCLSAMHLVTNYLNALGVRNPLPIVVGLTAYLAVMLVIRIRWGAERGARIALLGTLLILACVAETSIIVNCWTGQSSETFLESQGLLWSAFIAGLFICAMGFIFVHVLVIASDRIVDFAHWIFGLIRTRPPRDQ